MIINLLIIDDDTDFANFVADVAKSLNLNCTVTTNSNDFMQAYNDSVTLVCMDLNLPDIDGIELLRYIEEKKFKPNIILMSGMDKRVLETAEEYARAKGINVAGHFQKPIRVRELQEIIKKCIATPSFVEVPSIDQYNLTKNDLINAIQRDEFLIYYQPKISISSGKLYGLEALVRWQHPVHGLLFPDTFIHLAESTGLIDSITWIIFSKTMKEFATILEKIGVSIMLSLNVSPYSLHDLTFPDKLLALLKEARVSPNNIIIEITETELLNELASALDIFTRLRLKNIQLSIDDFGTGYAMMQQLKLIPATEIKIDKSFVHDMLKIDSARVTVNKVIEIGHELGMKVVAEGVDTREQIEYLKTVHCDIAQGYFYSKPVPIANLLEWIEKSPVMAP